MIITVASYVNGKRHNVANSFHEITLACSVLLGNMLTTNMQFDVCSVFMEDNNERRCKEHFFVSL